MTRAITFPLYLFLALWSVGFGYGFWWSLIAGEEATRSSMQNLQEDARDAATTISARISAVRVQLDNVVSWSDTQMAREERSGGSCGKRSAAGRGPLYNARLGVRDQVAALRDGVVNRWLLPIEDEIERLQNTALTLTGTTVEDRQVLFERRARAIRATAKALAERSNALGQVTGAEMRTLADTVRHQAAAQRLFLLRPAAGRTSAPRRPIKPRRPRYSSYGKPTLPKVRRASLTPSRSYGRT